MLQHVFAGVMVMLLTAAPALAQIDPAVKPRGGIWPGVIIAFILIAAIIAANAKRSGRGHQD